MTTLVSTDFCGVFAGLLGTNYTTLQPKAMDVHSFSHTTSTHYDSTMYETLGSSSHSHSAFGQETDIAQVFNTFLHRSLDTPLINFDRRSWVARCAQLALSFFDSLEQRPQWMFLGFGINLFVDPLRPGIGAKRAYCVSELMAQHAPKVRHNESVEDFHHLRASRLNRVRS